MTSMGLVFLLTGIVAGLSTMLLVHIFPPADGVLLQLTGATPSATLHFSDQLIAIFTVSDFYQLFSRQHLLALIVFAMLVGLACSLVKEEGERFGAFLHSGEAICMQVFAMVMTVAPVGFFAYFAVLVHDFGPMLLHSYARIALIYAIFSLSYLALVYTLYAYLATGSQGIVVFWKNTILPLLTGLATCSSTATIPANLQACKAMGIASEVYETAIPLGTLIHKEGSIIGGMIKIAFLFGVFHWDFSGTSVLLTALGVSFLVGTVMGAIPSGGMLGELLILSVYGFPAEALVPIVAISVIIDPFATMLNVTGNTASCLCISRLVNAVNGFKK